MKYSATFTSKGQLTIPKAVRQKLGYQSGLKVYIYSLHDGSGFVGKIQKKSKFLNFAGDLKHLDKGESLTEIKTAAQALAAKERVKNL